MDRESDKPNWKVSKELYDRVFEQCKSDLIDAIQSSSSRRRSRSRSSSSDRRTSPDGPGEPCSSKYSPPPRSSASRSASAGGHRSRQEGRRLRDRDSSVQSKGSVKSSGPDANISRRLSSELHGLDTAAGRDQLFARLDRKFVSGVEIGAIRSFCRQLDLVYRELDNLTRIWPAVYFQQASYGHLPTFDQDHRPVPPMNSVVEDGHTRIARRETEHEHWYLPVQGDFEDAVPRVRSIKPLVIGQLEERTWQRAGVQDGGQLHQLLAHLPERFGQRIRQRFDIPAGATCPCSAIGLTAADVPSIEASYQFGRHLDVELLTFRDQVRMLVVLEQHAGLLIARPAQSVPEAVGQLLSISRTLRARISATSNARIFVKGSILVAFESEVLLGVAEQANWQIVDAPAVLDIDGMPMNLFQHLTERLDRLFVSTGGPPSDPLQFDRAVYHLVSAHN